MTGKNIIALGLSSFISCVMAGQALAANAEDMGLYTVTNITNNTDIHDEYPNINSESAVVWQGQDPVAGQDDYEIFMYTPGNGEITQLTHNDFDDEYPEINSNGMVVWQAKGATDASGTAIVDNDYEIWRFSLADQAVSQVTDNDEDDESPHIADNGNGVVDLKVRFEADDLMELLKPGTAEIMVGGKLTDGTPFSGSALLGVKSKKDRRHNKKHHEKDDKHDD